MEVFNHHTQVLDLFQKHFGDRSICGVEIGTWCADLTKSILRELKNVRFLYTVDPWIYQEGNGYEGGHPQNQHDDAKKHALNALNEFGPRVVIMQMKSDEAFDKIDHAVDFVWIDGDHTIETVEKDIENGLKIVRKGGILGGHDYPTIKPAIDKILSRKEIYTGIDLTWWCYV